MASVNSCSTNQLKDGKAWPTLHAKAFEIAFAKGLGFKQLIANCMCYCVTVLS